MKTTSSRLSAWRTMLLGISCWLVVPLGWAQTTTGTLVRISTSLGPIDIRLLDAEAPRTTANFLAYVRSGAYNGGFFHRLVKGFVLQGGGFTYNSTRTPPVEAVATNPPIPNEFAATRSNLAGTIAMAKVDGNPDSATSQWFINLANNAANLDQQNGGFTVFGSVLTPAMAAVNAIVASSSLINASACTNLSPQAAALNQVPMRTTPSNCESVGSNNLVNILSVRELAPRFTVSEAERAFDYLEAYAPQFFAPSTPVTATAGGTLLYRHYPSTNTYIVITNGNVYGLGPATGGQIIPLGNLSSWVEQAAASGY